MHKTSYKHYSHLHTKVYLRIYDFNVCINTTHEYRNAHLKGKDLQPSSISYLRKYILSVILGNNVLLE